MKVLVIDDSGVIRSIIVRVLRAMGVRQIHEAVDGADAIELYDLHGFDLVLTDWHMPNIDGLELTQLIRQRDDAVPIVMITIVDVKEKVIEALKVGVTDYLCKPFERTALQAKLDRYVPVGTDSRTEP